MECLPEEHRDDAIRLAPTDRELERAARLFRTLGDVPRLRLLAQLAAQSACVSELAAPREENLSAMSQRLRILRAEDLVTRQRDGKHVVYALADDHIVALLASALEHVSEKRPVTPPPSPTTLGSKRKESRR